MDIASVTSFSGYAPDCIIRLIIQNCRMILCPLIFMSGLMKTVVTSGPPPWQFSGKYRGIFIQSAKGNLSTHSLLAHLACVWRAGFQPLSLQGMTDKGCPTKKINGFAEQNGSLCDPPPLLALVPACSQTTRLSTPTLLDQLESLSSFGHCEDFTLIIAVILCCFYVIFVMKCNLLLYYIHWNSAVTD